MPSLREEIAEILRDYREDHTDCDDACLQRQVNDEVGDKILSAVRQRLPRKYKESELVMAEMGEVVAMSAVNNTIEQIEKELERNADDDNDSS